MDIFDLLSKANQILFLYFSNWFIGYKLLLWKISIRKNIEYDHQNEGLYSNSTRYIAYFWNLF
jgi:hypothetical protein